VFKIFDNQKIFGSKKFKKNLEILEKFQEISKKSENF